MGTFSKAYVKIDSIEAVTNFIGAHYPILNIEVDYVAQDWRFVENGSDTIILSNHYNANWVEVILPQRFTLYFHDELLRRLTKELHSEILYGYYQSTAGTGRLAAFKEGALTLSIIQSEVMFTTGSRMCLTDNWGVTDELRKKFAVPTLREKYHTIDTDTIYSFFKLNGLEWDGIEREAFHHHLEIKYG